MSTAVYVIGFLVLIAGLAWAATILGVPTLWITIGVVVIAGIAILSLAANLRDTEARTPPPPQQPMQPQQPQQPQQPLPPQQPQRPQDPTV
jgi:predicted acyltransferase